MDIRYEKSKVGDITLHKLIVNIDGKEYEIASLRFSDLLDDKYVIASLLSSEKSLERMIEIKKREREIIKAIKDYFRRPLFESLGIMDINSFIKTIKFFNTRVNIIKCIGTINAYRIIFFLKNGEFKEIVTESYSTAKKLMKIKDSEIGVTGELDLSKDDMATLLELDINDIYDTKMEPFPRYYIYIAENGSLIVSNRRLRLGEQMLVLRNFEKEFIRLINDLPPSAKRVLKKRLGEYGFIQKKNKKTRIVIPQGYCLSTTFSTEYSKVLIDRYYEILDKCFSLIDADDFIKKFYMSFIFPIYETLALPHALLITNTNTGKTLLYVAITGESPISQITAKSLVGTISPRGELIAGILENRDLVVQIEQLESLIEGELVSILIDYMKSGKARRVALSTNIEIKGHAPLIFTGNIPPQNTLLGIQNLLKLGLLKYNPEALGSRLLFFYLDNLKRAKPLVPVEEINTAFSILRYIRDMNRVKKRLLEFWKSRKVFDYIHRKDSFSIEFTAKDYIQDIIKYFRTLSKNFYYKLRGLSLSFAIANTLPDFLDSKEEILFDKAEEGYDYFKIILKNSIEKVSKEALVLDFTGEINDLPLYLRLLVAFTIWLIEKKGIQDGFTLPLDETRDMLQSFLEKKGIGKKAFQVLYYIKKKVLPNLYVYRDLLNSIGIELFESERGLTIRVEEPQRLKTAIALDSIKLK